jgi:hypothetical protein
MSLIIVIAGVAGDERSEDPDRRVPGPPLRYVPGHPSCWFETMALYENAKCKSELIHFCISTFDF